MAALHGTWVLQTYFLTIYIVLYLTNIINVTVIGLGLVVPMLFSFSKLSNKS